MKKTFSELVNRSFTAYISSNGTVESVKGIEIIYEDILNKKFSDNFNQFYNNRFRRAFSDIQFRNLIQPAFPVLTKSSESWKIKNNEDLVSLVFKAESSPIRNNIYLLNEGDIELYKPLRADTLLFSLTKGRFVQGELKGNNEFYTNKLPDPYGTKDSNDDWIVINRVATKISYDSKNSITPEHIVTLKGKIIGSFPNTGNIYMQQRYPDHEAFKTHKFDIDEDGSFELSFDLHRPMDLTLRFGELVSDLTFAKDIFLEPGDELEININNQSDSPIWSFTGNSALKFQLLNQITEEIKPRKILENENLDTLVAKMWKKVHFLETKIKDQPLSVWGKKYLKTNIFVGVNKKIQRSNFSDRSKKKILDDLHIKWMEQTESPLYIYPADNQTRLFIDVYIEKKSMQLAKKYLRRGYLENFNVSKILLSGEVLYYSLSNYINKVIQNAQLHKAENMLTDFQMKFPDTEMSKIFIRQLGDYSVMKEGNMAPDFTLPTFDDKMVQLSEYRGKWVYVLFQPVEGDINANLNFLQVLKDSVEGPFTTLLVATDKNFKLKTFKEARKTYSGDLLINQDWENNETSFYNVSIGPSAFLINPNGEFEIVWDKYLQHEYIFNGKPHVYSRIISDYIRLKQHEFSKSNTQRSYVYVSLVVILLISALVWFYFKMRQKRFEREEARKREKVQLELKAIRSQLNPHFMFNTLNSIQHLVSDDRNEEACLYISEFSGLMRQVLNDSNKVLIPLTNEIEALQTYLKLEALRFGFDYQLEVDPNLETDLIEIPGLMVQPFVENAVIHGVSKLKDKGRIRISFQLHKNNLLCCVDDNGGGYSEVKNTLLNGQGIALSKRRLEVMKETYQLEIGVDIKNKREADPGKNGTLVEITYELNDV